MCETKPGEYFEWSEFEVSRTAARLGLDNTLPAWARSNVLALVANVLDPLRVYLGRPIRITSGYRSPEVNEAVGGSKTSGHMTGRAVDLTVRGMTAQEIAAEVQKLGLAYDQMIVYSPARGGHLHLSYREGNNRQQHFELK